MHQLHAVRPGAGRSGPRPGSLDQLVDLVDAARSRSHHSAPSTRAVSQPARPRAGRRLVPGGLTIASCQAVIPSEWRYPLGRSGGRRARRVGRRREEPLDDLGGALVERASRGAVRVALDPAIDGSGVSRSIPASSRARVLTHDEWPSRFGRNAGRSGTIASRSSRRGTPRSKSAMDQPLPMIQGVGVGAGVRPDRVEDASRPRASRTSHWIRSTPGADRVDVGVLEPGTSSRPRRSMTRVRGPISAPTSAADPTATIRSPRIATASARGRRGVDGVDVAAGQDEVGGTSGSRSSAEDDSAPARPR